MADVFNELRKSPTPSRMNRLNDRFVRYLFGNDRNKALLLDFINDALYLSGDAIVQDLELNAGELAQGSFNAKLSRLDISARLNNGITVDIEVQVINRRDFTKRFPYYWSLRHARQMRVGESYIEIKPTILICILAFDILDEEHFRNSYKIRNDDNGHALCDDLQLVFLELPKFKKTITEPHSGLERWLSYFSSEEENKMEKIAKADPMITAAMLIESEFWADDTERELYFAMQKQLMDEASAERSISIYAHQKGLEEGLEKGLQKGIQKGIQKGKKEGIMEGLQKGKKEGIMEGLQKGEHIKAIQTARKMLARKMDVSLIADVTGLSFDEITKLANS